MGCFNVILDLYDCNIQDFILECMVDVVVFGIDCWFENVGLFIIQGVELILGYDVVCKDNMIWNIGLIFSIYKIIFEEYVVFEEQCVNFGVFGQNGINMVVICEGQEIGQIWGLVFEGVGEDGFLIF